MIYLYVFLLLVTFVLYTFYFKPKAQLKRFKLILQNLGYSVYEEPFSFFGASLLVEMQIGKKQYKDAMYFQRTVFPHVDIVIGNIFNKLFLALINPDLMKEFLIQKNVTQYHKFEPLVLSTKEALGQGLVFSEGQVWKAKRKLLSKIFTFDLLKQNIPKMVEICDNCLNLFDQTSKSAQGEFKYNVQSLTSRMFNRVMMRCFFGCDQIDYRINGRSFQEVIINVTTTAAQLSMTPFMILFGKVAYKLGLTSRIRQIKDKIKLFRLKAAEIFANRAAQLAKEQIKEPCTDLAQAIIYEKLKTKVPFQYTDKDLIDQFTTFLVVGTDTTSRFLSMVIFYIGNNSSIQCKLRKQINEVIKSNQDITLQNLKKLTYIDMIQNETIRHYGPANGIFARIALEDNFIKDIPIKKGTAITIQPRGSHFNPKYFKNPEEFRPERWESQCDNIHPYAFTGFSGGPRNCIGRQLALLESKIAIVKIMMRYKTIQVPKELQMSFNFVYEAEPFETKFTK